MAKLVKKVIIPKIKDDCWLLFAQNPDQIPFEVKRFYLITDADPKQDRGFHAHKTNRQLFFCIRGSITLVLDDGKKREEILIDNPETGVEIPPLIWHEMKNFKKDTMLLVLASHPYDESDYLRDYPQFLAFLKNQT